VKSRAHHTRVEYCYIHDSANREFDLVDAADTERPESHAVVLGCVVVKNPESKGNRTVLHFGQDGGKGHDGTVTLAFNTIVTPFISPVVELSTPGAKARLIGNLVTDGGRRQANQRVLAVRGGAKPENASAPYNLFSGGFSAPEGADFDATANRFERFAGPLFRDAERHDYRMRLEFAVRLTSGIRAAKIELPAFPGAEQGAFGQPLQWQYVHPAQKQPRATGADPIAGAY
jgi:hypothetical protein